MTSEALKKEKDRLYKKVEARLHNYKNLDMQIDIIKFDIECYQADLEVGDGINYDGISSGETYKFNSGTENSYVDRAHILKLIDIHEAAIKKKEIEKRRIERALTCLDSALERPFFDLYFNSSEKNSMSYIAIKLHYQERKSCYEMKDRVVYKMMDMLYPMFKEQELPLLNYKTPENTHSIHS